MEEKVKLIIQIVDPLNNERFSTRQLVSLGSVGSMAAETAERMAQPFRKVRKPKLVKKSQ